MDNATVQEMGALADKAYTPYLKGATFTTDEKQRWPRKIGHAVKWKICYP